MFTNDQATIAPSIPAFGDRKWIPKGFVQSARSGDAADRSAKVRIVVVDDEALIAETLVEILNEHGFDARYVTTSAEAIELAREWHPHVVLSDVIMPGGNGVDTCIQITKVVPACRIILFSGQAATVDLLEKAQRDGYRFDILAKPIKPEQLIDIIRSVAGPAS
jgi:DNA-binding NtrC family response regulator